VFFPWAAPQEREHPRLGQAFGHGDKFCSWRWGIGWRPGTGL
jgi:hypothetical protein